jgi:cytochrome c556
MPMTSIKRKIKYLFLFCLIAVFTGTGCAEIKRSQIIKRTKTDSCDLSEMGKNRYYYTSHYKRSISQSVRKIHRR